MVPNDSLAYGNGILPGELVFAGEGGAPDQQYITPTYSMLHYTFLQLLTHSFDHPMIAFPIHLTLLHPLTDDSIFIIIIIIIIIVVVIIIMVL